MYFVLFSEVVMFLVKLFLFVLAKGVMFAVRGFSY